MEIKSLSCIESKRRGPRPQPWGVSAFRGQVGEAGGWRGEEKRGRWGQREVCRVLVKPGEKLPGGRGPCAGLCREIIIGFSELGSG